MTAETALRCAKCGQTKPASEFGRRRKTPTGRDYNCRACNNSMCRVQSAKRRAYGDHGTAETARLDPCRCADPSPRDPAGWHIEPAGVYAGEPVIAWVQTCRRCGQEIRHEFAPDAERLAEVVSLIRGAL